MLAIVATHHCAWCRQKVLYFVKELRGCKGKVGRSKGEWLGPTQRSEPEQSSVQVISNRKEGWSLSCFGTTSLLAFFHYESFTDGKFLQVSESSINLLFLLVIASLNKERKVKRQTFLNLSSTPTCNLLTETNNITCEKSCCMKIPPCHPTHIAGVVQFLNSLQVILSSLQTHFSFVLSSGLEVKFRN